MTDQTATTPSPRAEDLARDKGRNRAMGAVWVLFWCGFLVVPVWRALTSDQPRQVLGGITMVLASAGFAVAAFRGFAHASTGDRQWLRQSRWGLVVCVVASLCAIALVGPGAMNLTPFVAVALGCALPLVWSSSLVAVMIGGLLVMPRWLPGWGSWEGMSVGVIASFVGTEMGLWQTGRRRRELVENQRLRELELQTERNRMARDVHDILGHSLTAITLKNQLARRLLEVDPDAARVQLDEIDDLARTALAEVRSTVNNYREISLAAELAQATKTLEAAGVRAEVPLGIDQVRPDARELFAWAVREATTNVVRHAHAQRCTIELFPDRLVVADDGVGVVGPSDGHGLEGLRQRAKAAGATLFIGPGHGRTGRPGCRLEVVCGGEAAGR